MKKLLLLLSIIILPLSVYATSKHFILGTKSFFTGNYEIISDLQVNDLQIRQVRQLDASICSNKSQHVDHLEINGPINPDTPYIVEKLLKRIMQSPDRCIDPNDGEPWTVNIWLNSGGGYMEDGYQLGEIFRKNSVITNIASRGECYSSCATAFLGGSWRFMGGTNSQLMFHAPYTDSSKYGKDISCASSDKKLLSYMKKMLNETNGKFLYERTMSYCSSSSGWKLNKDAAELFEITKS